MKKILFKVLVGVVLLLVAAIVVVSVFLDRIVKAGVETAGPQIAKVEVKLDKVSLSMFSGKGELTGLSVGNPEGYKTASAIKAQSVSVALDPSSVFSDSIVIKSIKVASPEITLEGGPKNNNLTKILENIDASLGGTESAKSQQEESAGKSPKKIQVKDLMITDGKVHVSLPGMGGKTATVPLPTVHLTNVGSDSNGITAADLSKRVLAAVMQGSTKAATAAVADFGKVASEAAVSAGKSAVENAEKAVKGIGDLFKRK